MQCFVFFFRNLRMSDKEGSGSEGSLEEENFEVEEIREKMRGDDGVWLYYVKVCSCDAAHFFLKRLDFLFQWVGWESDTNTWEPVEHFNECPEMLENFERKWRKKQEARRERKKEEKERKLRERRERELKAAARFKLDSDSDSGGLEVERKKEKKRAASSSDSDSEEDRRSRDKSRKQKEERDKKRDRSAERRREEARKKEERKPKFFRDIKPEKILGVTTEPGELYFFIKWEGDKPEPSLVKAKEAYQKIPLMCLKFYEQHLIWSEKEEKKTEADTEPPQQGETEETSDQSQINKPMEEVNS